jgi:energy-coupling factor transporter ATP-binding protein EcfA2
MKRIHEAQDLERAQAEAAGLFAQALGLPEISSTVELVGTEEFLKFRVGRSAPVYNHALRETLEGLTETNPYRGLIGLEIDPPERFPDSVEANVLRGLLVRSTRPIAGQEAPHAFPGQYVPFQNNEETQAIQPATHLIVGRRGVGKTTLILKAKELLERSRGLPVVLDMQPYSSADDSVMIDVLTDLARGIAKAARRRYPKAAGEVKRLEKFAEDLFSGAIKPERASAALRREVSALTAVIRADLFIFLDDYHLVNDEQQPKLVEAIHGGLKGARGWLKVAGLRSLLKVYDPKTKKGLQSPGDAQVISLDLTLVDPEAAEDHLRKILRNFLKLVGVDKLRTAVAEAAFRRLVWANAGVPRDFLQMFSKSIEHAKRAGRHRVELSDANLAIGEFGRQKMAELEEDARNEQNFLKRALEAIEQHCLESEKKKVNAFLIRSESSEEYKAVQTLSDLRLVHLLHQTITPHKAGQRYEAYMLDYSLFTGFRQRRNIEQVLPEDGKQFKAKQLRKIPILPEGFLSQ